MNKKVRTYCNLLFPAFVVIMLVLSCKPSVPNEYIQPDEMEAILYDYHFSQALAYRNMDDSNRIQDLQTPMYKRNLYYQAVLKKHGVTEAEFDSSLVYYYSHSEDLYKIYKRVSERMEKTAIGVGAKASDIDKYSQLSENGDTANIWSDITSTIMMPTPPYNRLDFKIEGDSTFNKGDALLLNFVADFVYQGGTKDAVVYMAVKYDNDSISTHVTHISVSGIAQLRIPENTRNRIKNITGFIYLNRGVDESNTVKLLFINQIQLIRFHTEVAQEGTTGVGGETADSTTVAQPIATLPKKEADTIRKPLSHEDMQRMKPLQHAVREREMEKSRSK